MECPEIKVPERTRRRSALLDAGGRGGKRLLEPHPLPIPRRGNSRLKRAPSPIAALYSPAAPPTAFAAFGPAIAVRLRASNSLCRRQKTNTRNPITIRVHQELSVP